MGEQHLKIRFEHGLGDSVNFARMIPMLINRGYRVSISSSPDKWIIWTSAGASICDESECEIHHPWPNPGAGFVDFGSSSMWIGNKGGENLRFNGLLGSDTDSLWSEYKSSVPLVKLDRPSDRVNAFLEKIDGRRAFVWHSIGNTSQGDKSFSHDGQVEFADELLWRSPDSVLLILDWDSRVNWFRNGRVFNMGVEIPNMSLEELAWLYNYNGATVIGVDSGPFYFASMTPARAIGVYFNGHPGEFHVPWSRSSTIKIGDSGLTKSRRFEHRIVECDSVRDAARSVSECAIAGAFYSASMQHLLETIGLCRGLGGSGMSHLRDRDISFRIAIEHYLDCRDNDPPSMVETGCIRAHEDWGGAGMSTAIFGRLAQITGGKLTSFDISQENCNFASNWCRQFGNHASIVRSSGANGISTLSSHIDILYLDSLDTDSPGHAECNLDEFMAAENKLHSKSIVIIDDTPGLAGKGEKTVPYALSRGWKTLYWGYQWVGIKS